MGLVKLTTSASSAGVVCTASGTPHTEGAKTTLVASTPADVKELWLFMRVGSGSSTLVQLYTGAGGAEVALGDAIGISGNGGNRPFFCAVSVPSGTRLSASVRSATASVQCTIAVMGQTSHSLAYTNPTTGATAWTTLPTPNTGTSVGYLNVDAGATINTFTAGTLSASTAADYNFMVVSVTDIVSANVDFLVIVKDDGTIIAEEKYHRGTNGTPSQSLFVVKHDIAAGSALTVEVSCSGNTAGSRDLDITAYMFNLTASSGTILQGAAMQRAMKDAETTASRKRLFFDIRDSAGAAWAGSVTGLKAQLSTSGAAEAASTNDIVRVGGAVHYVELTNAEAAAAAAGDVIAARVAATTGRLESVAYLEITADDAYAASLTATQLAVENLLVSMGHRGHVVKVDGTDIVVTDTDGTTEIARQPFQRSATDVKSVISVGA